MTAATLRLGRGLTRGGVRAGTEGCVTRRYSFGGGCAQDAMGRTAIVPKVHTSQAGRDLAGNLAVT